jgi:hypothetical protein
MSSLCPRLLLIVISMVSIQLVVLAGLQEEIPRSIKSEDFTKNRPRSRAKGMGTPRSLSTCFNITNKAGGRIKLRHIAGRLNDLEAATGSEQAIGTGS